MSLCYLVIFKKIEPETIINLIEESMKKLMFVLAIAGLSSVAYAQQVTTTTRTPSGTVVRETTQVVTPTDRYRVQTNRFFDNWFISFGGGGQVLLGDFADRGELSKRIAPTANLSLGKWFTPGLGLRLQASGLQAKTFGLTDSYNRYGEPVVDGDGTYYKEEFKYLNLHGDILFNVSGMLAGYSDTRVYDFVPYVGLGWNHVFGDEKKNTLAWNFGIINRFRLSSAWDMNIELFGMVTEDRFDGKVQGKAVDMMLGASLGFAYNFPQRGFKHVPDVDAILSLTQSQLDAINADLARQMQENERLRTQLANRPNEIVNEKVVVRTVPGAAQSVFFEIGSSRVGTHNEVNLRAIADMLRDNSSATVSLTGYADSDTGSAQRNRQLSESRVNAVADILERMGVSRSRIQTSAMGGVDTLTPPSSNRRVLIEVK